MQTTILQIQGFLRNNEIDLALKKLQSIFSLSNSELVDDVVLLSAQFRKLQSDLRKGILDYAQENLSHNRITNAILSLLKEIKDDPDRFSEFDKVEKELDESIEERSKQALSPTVKDALFERLSYIKRKAIAPPALWIDDMPTNNLYECKVLNSIGVQLDLAVSSEQAYNMLKSKSYDLILSDISRDQVSDEGLRFHERLLREGIDIPLVFYTGFADRSRGVPPYAFGLADLPNELIHLVLDILERKY